jgi:hypothetical protein
MPLKSTPNIAKRLPRGASMLYKYSNPAFQIKQEELWVVVQSR